MENESPKQSKGALLVTYSLVLQPDGMLRTKVASIDPKQFLETADSVSKEWEGAPIIAKAIQYLMTQLETMDNDLDRYLDTL